MTGCETTGVPSLRGREPVAIQLVFKNFQCVFTTLNDKLVKRNAFIYISELIKNLRDNSKETRAYLIKVSDNMISHFLI